MAVEDKHFCPHVRTGTPACQPCVEAAVARRQREKAAEDARELARVERIVRDYTPMVRAPATLLVDRPRDFGRHTRSVGESPARELNFDDPISIGRRFTGGLPIEDVVQDPVLASGGRRRRS